MGLTGSIPTLEVEQYDSFRLETVFNQCFQERYRTRLYGGAEEPLYQPATAPDSYHALRYRADYFASALHEIAHWCIAGRQRRLLSDFGYWYTPEGRSSDQQRAFEDVEYKPQALEWFFSKACAYRFQVSLDNHKLMSLDPAAFKDRVLQQAGSWQETGLPTRSAIFYQALCLEYGTALNNEQLRFDLKELQ
jgi:elongation factor P hydroxylase